MTEQDKRSILWFSNAAHSPTGYGNQTAQFTPKLNDDYRVMIAAFYGREGAPAINNDGIPELPRLSGAYGNDVIEAHMQYSRAELVVSLIDPFVLNPEIWGDLPWCAWVPVDSSPPAPENLASIRHAKHVWSMSMFGQGQLSAAGIESTYVPHGINTEVYKPIDRIKARETLSRQLSTDLSEKFIVMTVAANKGTPSRKNFAGMLRAFALFAGDHPDAIFYIHSDENGVWGGEKLGNLATAYGIRDKVFFAPEYHLLLGMYPSSALNEIYNAADVFMLLSYGEGFGIPIVEAQAAGCPVIVTDGTAMRELSSAGWRVPAIPVAAMQGRLGCFWNMALPHEAAKALELAYTERNGTARRQQARDFALHYDTANIYETYMKPAVEAILNPPPKSKRNKRRAKKIAAAKKEPFTTEVVK